MKWLLFGSRGWIGGMVARCLESHNESVIETDIRADDEVEVERILESEKPDRIVCCIGRTHGPGCSTIDYLEHKGKLVENIRDNLFSPLVLALIAKRTNTHLTYLGTGCIFSYTDKTNVFTEDDVPNFVGSSYSTVKGFTDRLFHVLEDAGYPVLNVRIRMPIVGYHHPRNFITKITTYEKICSIPNSMTVLDDMIPIMVDMATQRHVGTVNLTNPGVIEHNEILTLYKTHVDPEFRWTNFTEAEQRGVLLSERSNNELDTHLLQSLYPNVKDIKSSVEDLMKGWGSYARQNPIQPE
jgi:3,5-epimerase/4-reductase